MARDHSKLAEFKNKGGQDSLFDDDPEYNEDLRKFNRLIDVCSPVVLANPKHRGKALGKSILLNYEDEFFGQYAEKDYNRAIREIREKSDRGNDHA